MTKDSETTTEFELVPFEDIFLTRIDEIKNLVKLVTFSIRSMEGIERLSKVLNKDSDHITQVAKIELLATSEVKSDFPLLHSAATILLWGALETSFKDFLVRWLQKHPDSRNVPGLSRIKIKLVEYENLNIDDRMHYLLDQFERELSAALRPGIGRFDCLLKPFELKPKVDDEVRRDLNEISAVRNILVHKAGIVDAKFVGLCPWLNLGVGEPVKVRGDDLQRYMGSAIDYVISAIEAVHVHPDFTKNSGGT